MDTGARELQIGFAGEEKPRAAIPTVIGRVKERAIIIPGRKPIYHMVGHDAIARRLAMHLSYPFQYGEVTSWEDLTIILEYAFQQALGVDMQVATLGNGCGGGSRIARP